MRIGAERIAPSGPSYTILLHDASGARVHAQRVERPAEPSGTWMGLDARIAIPAELPPGRYAMTLVPAGEERACRLPWGAWDGVATGVRFEERPDRVPSGSILATTFLFRAGNASYRGLSYRFDLTTLAPDGAAPWLAGDEFNGPLRPGRKLRLQAFGPSALEPGESGTARVDMAMGYAPRRFWLEMTWSGEVRLPDGSWAPFGFAPMGPEPMAFELASSPPPLPYSPHPDLRPQWSSCTRTPRRRPR